MAKKNNKKNTNKAHQESSNPSNQKEAPVLSSEGFAEETPQVPEAEEEAVQTDDSSQMTVQPELNAFQRLLIKIGRIKLPPAQPIPEDHTEEIEKLKIERDNLKLRSESFEITIKRIINSLNPELINLPNDTTTLITNINASFSSFSDSQKSKILKLEEELDALKIENESLKKSKSFSTTDNDSGAELKEAAAAVICDQEEIENLKKEITDLRKKKEAEVQEKNNLRKEKDRKISDLSDEIKRKNIRIDALEAERDKLNSKENQANLELANKISSLEKDNVEIQEKLDQKATAFDDLQNKFEDLQKKHEGSVENGKKAAETITVLREKIKQLEETDAGLLRNELVNANNEINALNERISKHDEIVASKEGEISALKENITAKEEECDKLASDIQKLKEDISSKETEIEKLNSKVQEKEEEIKSLNKTAELRSKEIVKLKEAIASKDSKIDELKTRVEELTSELKQALSEIDKLNAVIEEKEKLINTLLKNMEELKGKINSLKDDLYAANARADKSVSEFRSSILNEAKKVLEILNEGKYELGHGEMGETCADDEESNKRRFSKIVNKLESLKPEEYPTIGKMQTAFLDILSEEINKEAEGTITPLARLCAYSRIPFMRDDQGDDYMRLDYAKLSRLEQSLSKMLALVGIELILPTPFCDNIKEGDFEDRPGEIPNLDYICPNSRQHLDKVDRLDTDNIITDIVCVGYRILGQPDQKAKVIL